MHSQLPKDYTLWENPPGEIRLVKGLPGMRPDEAFILVIVGTVWHDDRDKDLDVLGCDTYVLAPHDTYWTYAIVFSCV